MRRFVFLKKILFVWIIFAISGLCPVITLAAGSLVITEIGAYESSGQEWIEIQNVSTSTINIKDWTFLENDTNHALSLAQGETSTLAAGKIAVITQKDQDFFAQYPDVTTTVFDSSWSSLKESGEAIALVNGDGEIVEQFSYISAPDFSLERISVTSSDYTENNWKEHPDGNSVGKENYWARYTEPEPANIAPLPVIDVATTTVYQGDILLFSATGSTDDTQVVDYLWTIEQNTYSSVTTTYTFSNTGTIPVVLSIEDEDGLVASTSISMTVLASVTQTTTTTPTSSQMMKTPTTSPDILINEFVSNPVDGSEWIELKNTATTSIDISFWTIADAKHTIFTITSSTIMASDTVYVIDLASAVLNNDGDSITLFDSENRQLQQVTYGQEISAPDKGNSLILQGDTYRETTTVTKNAENIYTAPIVEEEIPEEESEETSSTGGGRRPIQEENIVSCDADDIKISEIFPNPAGSDYTSEFIELWNPTDAAIDLDGCVVGDTSLRRYHFEEKTVIDRGAYLVLFREQSDIALNNSEDTVFFFDEDEKIIDSISYEETKENQSYAYVDGGFVWTTDVTPGAKNKKTTQDVKGEKIAQNEGLDPVEVSTEADQITVTSTPVLINELFPNPAGDDSAEFIELYNPTTAAVDLSGFWLDDATGGSAPYMFPDGTNIDSHEYLIFRRDETGLALNNSAEEVRLLAPDQTEIARIQYPLSYEDAVFARNQYGNFQWSELATPGEENQIVQTKENVNKTPVHPANIDDLKDGEMIRYRATISVEPGTFSTQYFYLGYLPGMQVYLYTKDFPDLHIGDIVEVVGEVSNYQGNPRVKIANKNDIFLTGESENTITPIQDTLDKVKKAGPGFLVRVQGEVTEKGSGRFWIDDGVDEIMVYIKQGTGISLKDLNVKDHLVVTGMTMDIQGERRLLPRSQDDIEQAVPTEMNSSTVTEKIMTGTMADDGKKDEKKQWWLYIGIIVAVGVLALVIKYIL